MAGPSPSGAGSDVRSVEAGAAICCPIADHGSAWTRLAIRKGPGRLTGVRCRPWLPAVLAGLALTLLVARSARAESDVAAVYRVQATLLAGFPQFVEWPPEVVAAHPTGQICVLEPNPFGHVLEDLLSRPDAAGRPLRMRTIPTGAPGDGCLVLFLPSQAPGRDALLHRVTGAPILTVSDAPHFLDRGGIIQTRVVDTRVRFSVSLDAARAAGLRLNAQILRLAIEVRGGRS